MEYRKIEPAAITGNPFELIGKEWALVSAQKAGGTVNTMTVSWGSMGVLWGKNVVQIFLRPQRYTKEFVDEAGRFTLSFYGEGAKKELGYLGKVSGRDEDKIAKVGYTVKTSTARPPSMGPGWCWSAAACTPRRWSRSAFCPATAAMRTATPKRITTPCMWQRSRPCTRRRNNLNQKQQGPRS